MISEIQFVDHVTNVNKAVLGSYLALDTKVARQEDLEKQSVRFNKPHLHSFGTNQETAGNSDTLVIEINQLN